MLALKIAVDAVTHALRVYGVRSEEFRQAQGVLRYILARR
jgi:hypothetical protein